MIPKHLVQFVLIIIVYVSTSYVSARELKQVAPACSGNKCFTCSGEVAPVISGSVCTCNGGTPCTEVGSSLTAPINNVTDVASSAVANAAAIANSAVSNAMDIANQAVTNAGASAGAGTSCPQHGDGQGGSRCGTVDLIGYCEDSCGSGDGACCIQNKPICAC